MTKIFEILKGQSEHVMRVLGKGHRERVYHRALITALNKARVAHRSEVTCPIWFMGECIGMGRADLVIDDVVVEIKANKLPPQQTSPQVQKYILSLSLAERKKYKGMVINFNQDSGEVDIFTGESDLFKRSIKEIKDEVPRIFRKMRKT
jgi:GxxExxY protein